MRCTRVSMAVTSRIMDRIMQSQGESMTGSWRDPWRAKGGQSYQSEMGGVKDRVGQRGSHGEPRGVIRGRGQGQGNGES